MPYKITAAAHSKRTDGDARICEMENYGNAISLEQSDILSGDVKTGNILGQSNLTTATDGKMGGDLISLDMKRFEIQSESDLVVLTSVPTPTSKHMKPAYIREDREDIENE